MKAYLFMQNMELTHEQRGQYNNLKYKNTPKCIENLGPEISREERLFNKCCWDHWEASGKKQT